MNKEKHVTHRIRIIVKAYPQPSAKYQETVCCAGITEETNEFLRLYPIRYRRLAKADQFNRYDLVEMTITKDTDPRPESYHVNEDSIRLLEREKTRKLSDESKVRLWKPFIAPSLEALNADNKSSGRSLGIIRPDPGSLEFEVKPINETSAEDKEVMEMVYNQTSLLEDPLEPLEKPKYSFSYHYKSAGKPHHHQLHDWEVQAAFFKFKKRYGSDEKALEKLKDMYQNNIPGQNPHFVMGTMKRRPYQFIVVGLLRTGLDPEELDRQKGLF
jgi:hypothetical protein